MTECTRRHHAGGLGGWLELVRPPNLFTVPGDVLAGAALAGIAAESTLPLLAAVVVSLLLYTAGLMLNDYVDRRIDARERPARPIPSGRVSAAAACAVSLVLMAIAIVVGLVTGATQLWVTAFVLSGLILFYDGPARRVPVVGFVAMGLCRGCNVILGAAAVGGVDSPAAIAGAGMETLYIFCVTWLAHGEVNKPPARRQWLLPLATVAAMGPVMSLSLHAVHFIAIIPMMILLAWLWATVRDSGPTPKKIGALIRGLILLQALLVIFAVRQNPAWFNQAAIGVLILMFVAAEWAGKRFYGS